MQTPWGKSDSETKPARGVTWVGTPGHGGFMIAKGVAKKSLSLAAQKRGESYGRYLAYEEDCAFAMVAWEHPEWLPSPGLTKEKVLNSLSSWNADYLIERGITPEPEGYAYFLENEADHKLRTEKSPDLVVAAWGSRVGFPVELPEGKVGIATADGKYYLADAASYEKRSGLNLLSKLTGVELVEKGGN